MPRAHTDGLDRIRRFFTVIGFAAALSPLLASEAQASEAIWLANCDGCHGATPAGARVNAANGSATLFNAIFNALPGSMGGFVASLSSAQKTSLGTYIESVLNSTPQSMGTTPYNVTEVLNLGTKITMGSLAGFNVLETVSGPSRGTVTYNTATPSLTYNPATCEAGSDSFTYRARNSASSVVSGTRTVNITIAATPTISSLATHSGTVGTAISSYTIASSAFPCPSDTTWGATSLPPGVTRGGANSNVLSGTPTTAGTYNVTLSATNAYASDNQTLTFTVSKGNQTISWLAPATPRAFTTTVQNITPLASGGGSGIAIVYTVGPTSGSVCSVNNAARTFTMLTAGNCVIEANQAGNSNYNAAPEVTRTIVITPTVPAAPTINVPGSSPGPLSANVAFTAPTNNGGQPISQYTATCSAAGQTTRSNTGGASPITVGTMTTGVPYSCSVTATNATGTGAASGTVSITPSNALAAPVFTSAAATTFTVQQAGTFTVTATGNPAPTRSLVSGTLPTGVTFTPATGVLAGTPAAGTAGTHMLTFRATNNTGVVNNVDQSFTLTVNLQNQTISFTQPTTPTTFSLTPVPLTASASSGLGVTFTSNTPSVCTISGGTNAVMQSVGSCMITASQAGNTVFNAAPSVPRSFDIGQGSQTITFNTQLTTARTYSPGATFAINPTATASSGLAVTHGSSTPSVCTVIGTTVTMQGAGTCTLTANQAGNGNWLGATQATQNVTINATVPDAPTIGTATPAGGQASISFTPPANNGGSTITGYTVTCNPGPVAASGGASPIVVTGLTNGNAYTCSVIATNAVGNSAASGTVGVTPNVSGEALWQSVCSTCHGVDPPSGPRFNAAGTTSSVLEYVRATQPLMQSSTEVQALDNSELAAIAAYIAEQVPEINTHARTDTAKPISVSSHLRLNTVSFTSVEVMTPPAVGTLSAFTGTEATYTPPNGFTGQVMFTYRGRRDSPALVLGDPRTVTIDVQPTSRQLALTKTGLGTGLVSSSPLGLSCGATCTDFFQDGKQLTLMAIADFGSLFTGWSGASCEEGVNTDTSCTLTMGADVALTANFVSDSPPQLSAPSPLAFGTRVSGTGLASLPLLVTNAGTGDTTPLSVVITGTHAADFGVSYPCNVILALTDCTFTVSITPGTLGARTATLQIMSNDPVNPTISIDLTANVIAADTTPNAFAFIDHSGAALATVRTSNAITVAGINSPAAISVTGGTYSIGCTTTFTSVASTIANGQTVCVRHTSSASFGTATNTVLTIGGVSDTFTSTTVAADTTPTAFTFTDVTNVAPGAVQTSNAITVAGINSAAAISVTGGTYSIGCTATFTAVASTITNGQTVCVRHTAPMATSASTNTALTVGGVSDTFTSTTVTSLPPNGDFDNDGIPNSVETVESRNPFLKDNDVFANNRLFAMQQYRDFLAREGDVGGIQFYVDLLNGGTATRAQIIESFLLSPEFQNGLPSITRLYFSFFGRIPDYGGLTFQLDAFRSGTPLEVIAQNFFNSPEFTNTYGALTNDQYINLVYQNVLNRAPDPDGYTFYLTHLTNGTLTKGQMMIGFSESAEFQNITSNESFVVGVYVGMLKRTPEPAGLDFYVDLLDGGTARSAIIPGFFNSPEYHSRFLP